MFSLMACCFQWVKERREPRKQVTLALIGLDNAGKTTALKGVQGESNDNTAPTVGFADGEFKLGKFDVTVFDLGGGKKIRGIWSNYYAEVHGIIFVIDASAEDRLQECKECLEDVLKKDKVRGKRILLLANKQDREGALDEIDICDQLDLEDIVNNSKCPCRVETCSAVQGIGKNMDPSIREGMQWLLDGIKADWPRITKRVEEDTREQKEEQARKREEIRAQVRKQREERQKREAEERKAKGLPEKEDSDDEDIVAGGDPFKKVDNGYFAKKKNDDEGKKKKKKSKEEPREEEKSNGSMEMKESGGEANPEEPPSRTQNDDKTDEGERNDENSGASDSGLASPKEVTSAGEESKQVVVGSQENLLNAQTSETSLGDGEEKKKKKKKKIKKNKTAPMPVEGIDEVTPPPLPTPLATPSWAQAPGHRNIFKASQKPTLAPLVEQNSPRQTLDPILPSSTTNHRRRELPELRSLPLKPNTEDENDVMT
ncbi:uncharacterized protein [Diadema setosum]|uniref:uncharacterized protein n=1 Tax=Diadema setosum TaxID=31175 RepID=UPI003B3A7511